MSTDLHSGFIERLLVSIRESAVICLTGSFGSGKSYHLNCLPKYTASEFDAIVRLHDAFNCDWIGIQQQLLQSVDGSLDDLNFDSAKAGNDIISRVCAHRRILVLADDVRDVGLLSAVASLDYTTGTRLVFTSNSRSVTELCSRHSLCCVLEVAALDTSTLPRPTATLPPAIAAQLEDCLFLCDQSAFCFKTVLRLLELTPLEQQPALITWLHHQLSTHGVSSPQPMSPALQSPMFNSALPGGGTHHRVMSDASAVSTASYNSSRDLFPLPDRVRSVLQVLLQTLKQRHAVVYERLNDCVVFHEGVAVSLIALGCMWGTDAAETRETVETLVQYGVASQEDGVDLVSLLPMVARVLIADTSQEQVRLLHAHLVKECTRHHQDDLCRVTDPYLLSRLIHHLVQAAQESTAVQLVLNWRWLEQKCRLVGVHATLTDFQLLRHDPTCRVFEQALQQSRFALLHDASQVRAQLLARLEDRPDLPDQCRSVLDSISESLAPVWLRPLSASLTRCAHLDMSLCRTMVAHTGTVHRVAMNLQGTTLVSSSADGMICVWNLQTGAIVHRLRSASARQAEVTAVVISGDGTDGMSADEFGAVYAWDFVRGVCLSQMGITTDTFTPIAISLDGRRAATVVDSTEIHIWDLQRGKIQRTLSAHKDAITALAICVNGPRLVSGSESGLLRVWDMQYGQVVGDLQAQGMVITAVAVSANGVIAVSASADRSLVVWNLSTMSVLGTLLGHAATVTSLSLTQDATRMVSASEDGVVILWDVKKLRELKRISSHEAVWSVDLSNDAAMLVTAGDDWTIRVWDLDTNVIAAPGHDRAVTAAVIGADGSHLVTGSNDMTVKVWRFPDLLATLVGHSAEVTAVGISADNAVVVSGSSDCTVRVWTLPDGSQKCVLSGFAADVTCVAVSANGAFVACGSADNQIRLSDTDSAATLFVIATAPEPLVSVGFAVNDSRLIAESRDGQVAVFDAKSSAPVSMQSHMRAMKHMSQAGLFTLALRDMGRIMCVTDGVTQDVLAQFVCDAEVTAYYFHVRSGLVFCGDADGGVHLLKLTGYKKLHFDDDEDSEISDSTVVQKSRRRPTVVRKLLRVTDASNVPLWFTNSQPVLFRKGLQPPSMHLSFVKEARPYVRLFLPQVAYPQPQEFMFARKKQTRHVVRLSADEHNMSKAHNSHYQGKVVFVPGKCLVSDAAGTELFQCMKTDLPRDVWMVNMAGVEYIAQFGDADRTRLVVRTCDDFPRTVCVLMRQQAEDSERSESFLLDFDYPLSVMEAFQLAVIALFK